MRLPSALASLMLLACGHGYSPADVDAGGDIDAAVEGAAAREPAEWCSVDTDGDLIADYFEDGAERDGPADDDGVVARLDDDSDGDGLTDFMESGRNRGDDFRCAEPADCDADGVYDFVDLDSDNDGVPDAMEASLGFEPCNTDSDGDGCPDGAQALFGDCERWLHVLIDQEEFGPVVKQVTFRVPEGLGSDVALHLELDDFPGARPVPRDALQSIFAPGASSLDGGVPRLEDTFRGVQAGTDITFELTFVRPTPLVLDATFGRLQLKDEQGETVDTVNLLAEFRPLIKL